MVSRTSVRVDGSTSGRRLGCRWLGTPTLMLPPTQRCSPTAESPPRPSRGCSEQSKYPPPNPLCDPKGTSQRDIPELCGHGAVGGGTSVAPLCCCCPPPPHPPSLRAGACRAQTRCLQHTTTLISEMGSAGKRLPPLRRVARRRGHFQDLPVRWGGEKH